MDRLQIAHNVDRLEAAFHGLANSETWRAMIDRLNECAEIETERDNALATIEKVREAID